jgi:hypothetical protein
VNLVVLAVELKTADDRLTSPRHSRQRDTSSDDDIVEYGLARPGVR